MSYIIHVFEAETKNTRQHWRCSACLNDARKHTRSISSSKPVLPRHSIVRDIFRPRGAESPATTNLSGPTKESTFDGHIGCQTFCASTPDSRGLEILNKPKDIIGSFLRSEPEQFDLSEVPRTPTRYLSKPDSSGSSSQPHHVRAQNEAVVLDSSTALQKCVSPIALCSVCQKRSILVRSGDGSAQWYAYLQTWMLRNSNLYAVKLVKACREPKKRNCWRYLRLLKLLLFTTHKSSKAA